MSSPCSLYPDSLWEECYFGRLDPAAAREVEAHLAECRSCRRRQEIVAAEVEFLRSVLEVWEAAGVERRRSVREPAAGVVALVLRLGRGKTVRVEGQLRDESPGGIGLVCGRRFRAGREVTVERGAGACVARVCWCRPMDGGYRLGLQLLVA